MSASLEPNLRVEIEVKITNLSEDVNPLQVTEKIEFLAFRYHTGKALLQDIDDILASFRAIGYRLQDLPLREKKGEK